MQQQRKFFVEPRPMEFEIKRKIFHALSFIFPLSYFFVDFLPMAITLGVLTFIVLSLDISRRYNPKIQELLVKLLGPIMLNAEKKGRRYLSSASYMFLGLFVTVLIAERNAAIAGWLVLIISDTAAAMIGKTFGEPGNNGKSIAGSIAFFVTALAIGLGIHYYYEPLNDSLLPIIVAAYMVAVAEYFAATTIPIDDNFLIPVAFSFLCTSTTSPSVPIT